MGASEGLHQLVRRGGFGPEKRVEPGSVRVSIGSSSRLIRLSKVLKVD